MQFDMMEVFVYAKLVITRAVHILITYLHIKFHITRHM